MSRANGEARGESMEPWKTSKTPVMTIVCSLRGRDLSVVCEATVRPLGTKASPTWSTT